MGTARSVFFTTASIICIISGAAGVTSSVLLLLERMHSPGTSLVITVISAILAMAYSVILIITGIKGASHYNKRTNSAVVIRPPVFSVLICVFSLFFSVINGILVWQIILLAVTGIIVPIVFILSAVKKSYA